MQTSQGDQRWVGEVAVRDAGARRAADGVIPGVHGRDRAILRGGDECCRLDRSSPVRPIRWGQERFRIVFALCLSGSSALRN